MQFCGEFDISNTKIKQYGYIFIAKDEIGTGLF